MANNLLIVFGGTTENTVVFPSNDSGLKSSRLFSNQELEANNVDVLQINVLTTDPSISFYAHQSSPFRRLNGVWVSKKEKSIFLEEHMIQALRDIGDVIKKVDWGSLYRQGSSARGMNVEQFNDFSRTSKSLILNFLKGREENYSSIFMLAHSRGCALALQSLSKDDVNKKSEIGQVKLEKNVLMNKLKRIVLLDPVSKNASSGWFWSTNANAIIPPANAKIVAELSQTDKEIHIVSKAKSASIDYDSYVDVLVGAKGSNDDGLNFSNIYVHIADMVHEGMLSEELRGNFKKYLNIIMDKPWTQTYFNDQEVSAGNFLELSKAIEVKDRRDAFKRCIQNKNGLA